MFDQELLDLVVGYDNVYKLNNCKIDFHSTISLILTIKLLPIIY